MRAALAGALFAAAWHACALDALGEGRRSPPVDWQALPFQWALTVKRGAGRREIAVLSDPSCSFCRRFERDLATLDDVTVHVFMYPVSPDSAHQVKAVWCSSDRVKAWNDLMQRRVQPAAAPTCDTPVQELVALGQRLGARATPAWILRSGELHSGAMRMSDLVPLMEAAAGR